MTDAAVPAPGDAGVDAADDAGVVDAGVDAEADGGVCDCPSTEECTEAACVEGTCVESALEDGTPCGEMGLDLCVSGSCVARGCGDGFREPATSSMREGCDDGNTVDGDGCSSSCTPEPVAVAHDPLGDRDMRLAPQGASVGVDGDGRVLFVFQEDRLIPNRALAQRAEPSGALVGELIVIADDVGDPPWGDPRVAGLRDGGWVVVWHQLSGSTEFDVRYRLVSPDGVLGPVRTAHADSTGRQYQARVASLGGGFVVVWTAAVLGAGYDFTVKARRFNAVGSPLGGEFVVPTSTTNLQETPAVASSGEDWLVAWSHHGLSSGSAVQLFVRRFDGATAVDSGQVEIAESGGTRPYAAPLESGEFVVVWQDYDVWSQIVPSGAAAPDPADKTNLTPAAVWDNWPVVAPLTGRDFVIAWAESSAFDPIRFAGSPGAMLAPEAALLEARLELGAEQDVSVAASPDGVWFLWAGYDGLTPGLGLSAFHLPVD